MDANRFDALSRTLLELDRLPVEKGSRQASKGARAPQFPI